MRMFDVARFVKTPTKKCIEQTKSATKKCNDSAESATKKCNGAFERRNSTLAYVVVRLLGIMLFSSIKSLYQISHNLFHLFIVNLCSEFHLVTINL